jgi:cysteine desulfuration protein SufE
MVIEDAAQELRDEFAFLDDWEARYEHIIDLGKSNPDLQPEERNENSRVRGCASQVWLVTKLEKDGRMTIRAESDAVLVSGLIAILTRLYSGQTPDEIAAYDAKALFRDIGVSDTLTAQRSNGLASMLSRIKVDAAAALG